METVNQTIVSRVKKLQFIFAQDYFHSQQSNRLFHFLQIFPSNLNYNNINNELSIKHTISFVEPAKEAMSANLIQRKKLLDNLYHSLMTSKRCQTTTNGKKRE